MPSTLLKGSSDGSRGKTTDSTVYTSLSLHSQKLPDHDYDEKEEKYLIFSHVQFTSLCSGTAEQDHAKRLDQFQE
jgi:hypothetical protein